MTGQKKLKLPCPAARRLAELARTYTELQVSVELSDGRRQVTGVTARHRHGENVVRGRTLIEPRARTVTVACYDEFSSTAINTLLVCELASEDNRKT